MEALLNQIKIILAIASADMSEDLSLDILMMPLERLRTVYTVAEQSIVI